MNTPNQSTVSEIGLRMKTLMNRADVADAISTKACQDGWRSAGHLRANELHDEAWAAYFECEEEASMVPAQTLEEAIIQLSIARDRLCGGEFDGAIDLLCIVKRPSYKDVKEMRELCDSVSRLVDSALLALERTTGKKREDLCGDN